MNKEMLKEVLKDEEYHLVRFTNDLCLIKGLGCKDDELNCFLIFIKDSSNGEVFKEKGKMHVLITDDHDSFFFALIRYERKEYEIYNHPKEEFGLGEIKKIDTKEDVLELLDSLFKVDKDYFDKLDYIKEYIKKNA